MRIKRPRSPRLIEQRLIDTEDEGEGGAERPPSSRMHGENAALVARNGAGTTDLEISLTGMQI